MADFFDNIPGGVDPELTITTRGKTTKAAALPFPCVACAGTGKVRKVYGYTPATTRTYENTCKVCNGKGGFVTSRATREQSRQKATERKQRQTNEARAAFDAAHPGVRDFLVGASKWSTFAASLLGGITRYGNLTEQQLAAAHSMMEKATARDAARAQERRANTVVVDATAILALFAKAAESGLKRRALLAGGAEGEGTLKITPSKESSRNAGGVWVKADGEFLGGITAAGEFKPRHGAPAWVTEAIKRVANDPAGEARLFGQRTGKCCCCARELTDGDSIAAGIGPICAEKWGL